MPFVLAPKTGIPSAIAPIVVFGTGSADVIAKMYGNISARVGDIIYNGKYLDEAVVKRLPANESFTGEDTFLLFTHGNPAIVNSVVGALRDAGCTELSHDEFLLHMYRSGRMDMIQVEAHELLLSVPFPKAVKMLCSAASGTLSRFVRQASEQELELLARTASTGISLVRPKRIVICGAQNAGKSTLFNRLVMAERAIVSDIPGTTRDYIDEVILVDGFPFVLEDTAGIGTIQNQIDEVAQKKSLERIYRADIVIHLIDGTNPVLLARPIPNSIQVWNKVDLADCPHKGFIPLSAKTGAGIDKLNNAILSAAGIDPLHDINSPTVFTNRQIQILQSSIPAEQKKELLLAASCGLHPLV